MALSDLAVFTEFTYAAATQVVAQQVALFNEAAAGTFILRDANHLGDYSDRAFWQRLNGLIRRRNAYGDGNIPEINFTMLTDSMVKVAAGTPVVRMDPGQFKWINQDPEAAGVQMGQQLAVDMVRDMFNVAASALLASHAQVPGLITDVSTTAANAGDGGLTQGAFNKAQARYGDRYTNITAWVLHSSSLFQLWGANLKNVEQLYRFNDLAVLSDFLGRRFIVSDIPSFVIPAHADSDGGGPDVATPEYRYSLGVTPGAVLIDQNDEFTDNWDTSNGKENIKRTYQAEWTYNVGVKGFSWDKTNGGKSPTDAALTTATNWDRVAGFNDRDLGCVIIKSRANDAG